MLESDHCHSLSLRLIRKTDGYQLFYLSCDLSSGNVTLGGDLVKGKAQECHQECFCCRDARLHSSFSFPSWILSTFSLSTSITPFFSLYFYSISSFQEQLEDVRGSFSRHNPAGEVGAIIFFMPPWFVYVKQTKFYTSFKMVGFKISVWCYESIFFARIAGFFNSLEAPSPFQHLVLVIFWLAFFILTWFSCLMFVIVQLTLMIDFIKVLSW